MPLDYNQFAEKIKQKYPEYKDIDNYTLATKMVEKYPEYQTQVSLKKKEESQSTLVQDNTSSDRLNKTTTKPTVSSSLKGEGIYTIQGQPEGTFYKKVGNDWYKKQYKVFDYTKVTDPNRIKQIESNTIEYKPKPKEDLYILPSNPDALYKKSGGKWMKKVGKNYVYLTGDKVSEREAILNKQAKKASQFDLDRMANYAPDVVQQEEAKPIENKELKKSFEEKYGDIKVLEKEMELKRQEELKKQAPAEKEYFNWRIGAGKIFDFDDPASVEAYGNISPSFYMDFYDSHGNPISTMNAENMKIAEQNMKKDFGESEFKAFHSIADIPSREKLASLGEGNAAKLLNEKFKGTNIHFYQDGSEIRIVSSLYNGIDNTILNEKTFDLNYSGADKYIRSFAASNLLKKSEKEKFDKVSSLDDLVEIVGTNPYKFPASLLEDIDVDSYYSKKRKMLEGELNRSKADTYQQDSKEFESQVQSFNNQIKSGSMTQQEFDKKSAELETKRKELESRRRLISNAVNEAERIDKITNNLYKANVIDSQKKEQEGSFLGIIGRQFGQGLTNVSKTALDFTAAAGSLFTDAKTFANTISPGSYENLKNLGYTDEEIKNETQKTIKSAGNKILEDVPDIFGAGTTKEYVQSKDRGQIEQAIGSLAESLGTMAGGIATTPGLSTGVTPAFFAMSYNAMEDQMRGPAFDALSENEKKIISLPYGLIIGQLEKFGAKVGMNAAKNPTINAFSQYILGKTFSSIPKNASLLEVKSAIDKSVAASIASGMIKITGAGVVEGGTEFTQQIFEGIEKDVANRIIQSNQLSAAGEKYDGKIPDQIVNQIKENKFFKDAGDLTTYEGISNLFSQSVDAFNIGFLAGGMGGTVDVAIKDPIENKVSNNRFKIYKDVVTNDRAREGFISAINKKVDDGELTRMEADDQIKSVNESYSTMMKIPNDLSTSAQKEAFSLMSERNQLEKQITGKDPSLVAKQKDRVAEIDEQLKGLSYAVQERSTEEVLPRESEAVGETGGQREGMGQGVQGEIVAEEGPITQEEKVAPKAEIGGIIRGYESISEQDNVGDVRSELPNQNQGTVIVEGKDGNQYAVAFSRKGADGKNIFEQGTTTPRPGYISASVKIEENATPEQIQAAQQEAQRNLDIILPTVVDGAINPQAINEIMAQQAPAVQAAAPVVQEEVAAEVDQVAAYRAEEQAELLKAIPEIENYKVDGEIDKNLMPKTVLEKYNQIYEKYDRLISPLLETNTQEKATVASENELTDRNVRTMSVKYKRNPIVKAATNVLKALPGVKIYLHENTDQYSEALANKTGENKQSIQSEESAGSYIDGEIHLDMSQANTVTLLHEAVHHALMVNGVRGNYIIDMANGLRDIIKDKNRLAELDAFIKQYKGETDQETLETRSDEFVAQLGGILAANQEELTTTGLTKFKALINRLFKKLGFGNVFTAASTSQDAVNFINTITRGLNVGENITQLEPYSVGEAASVKPNAPMKVKYQRKSEYDVDFVTKIPTKSLKDVVDKYDGKVFMIQSDATGVGYDSNGDPIYGGIGYIAIKENVDGKIGFASVDMTTAKTTISKMINRYGPNEKIVTLVMVQNPSSTVGNYYGGKYFGRGLIELQKQNKKNYKAIAESFVNFIESKQSVVDALNKNKTHQKLIDLINNPGKYDEVGFAQEFVKDTTFDVRREILKTLLPEKADIRTNKSTPYIKQSLKDLGFNRMDFLNEYGDNTLFNEEMYASDEGGLLAAGFEITLPESDKIDEFLSGIENKGIEHHLFNGKLPYTDESFLLDGLYPVNENFSEFAKSQMVFNEESLNKDQLKKIVQEKFREDKSYDDKYTRVNSKNFVKREDRTYTHLTSLNKIKFKAELQETNPEYFKEQRPDVATDIARGMGFTAEKGAKQEALTKKARTEGFSKRKKQLVYHGGDVVTESDLKNNEPLYVSKDKKQAELYAKDNKGKVVEFDIDETKLADEKIAFDLIKELGLEAGEGWNIDELNLFELIDPRFETSMSESDTKKLFNELTSRGYDGIKFMDTNLETLKQDIENYVIINPKKTIFSKRKKQLTTNKEAKPGYETALEALGETEAQREEWRKNNKVNQKQKRNPIVEKAAKDYYNEEISQEEYLDIVAKNQPIKPFTKVPTLPTLEEITNSLDSSKVATGIVGLTKNIEDGEKVASRLDIPAYEDYDTWVVSIHDGIKEGKSIAYGQTAVLKNVEFKTNPTVAINIASAKINARGQVTPKSTIARMFGEWVNEDPEAVHARAQELMNDPAWTQVGMNPFRYSWFYDKADGMPLASADEVVQVGALVLAKNAKKVSPSDPMFETKSAKGGKIKFQKAPKILGQQPTKVIVNDEAKALIGQIKLEIRAQREQKKAQTEVRKSISDNVKAMVKKGSINLKQASTIISTLNRVNLDNPEMVKRFNDYIAKVFDKAEYIDKVERATRMKKKIKQNLKGASNPFAIAAKGFSQLEPKWVENIDDYIAVAQAVYDSVRKSTVKKGVINWKQEADFQEIAQYIFDEEARQTEMLLGNLRSLYERITGKPSDNVAADVMQAELKDLKVPEDFNAEVLDQIEERLAEFEQMVEDSDPDIVKKAASIDPTIIPTKESIRILDALDTYFTNGSIAGLSELMSLYIGKENVTKFKGKAKVLRALGSKKLAQNKFEQVAQLNMILERKFRTKELMMAYKKASGIQDIENGANKAEAQAMKKQKEYLAKFGKVKGFRTAENIFQRGALANLLRTMVASEELQQEEFDRNITILRNSVNTLSKGNAKDRKKAGVYKKVLTDLGVFRDDVSIDMVLSKAKKENIEAVNFVIDMFADIVDPLSDLALGMYNQILTQDINYTPYVYKMIDLKKTFGSNQDNSGMDFFSISNYANQTFDKNKAGILMPITRPKNLTEGMHIDLDFDNNMFRQYRNALVDLYTAGPIRQFEGFFNSEENEKILGSNEDLEIIKGAMIDYVRTKKGSNYITKDGLEFLNKITDYMAQFGAARALVGVGQFINQFSSGMTNTIINAGEYIRPGDFSKEMYDFMANSGRAIANVGGNEIRIAMSDVDKSIEAADLENRPDQYVLKFIAKENMRLFNIMVAYPDAVARMSAWMAYYRKSMVEQGLLGFTESVDTTKMNDKAADYAQMMVDRNMDATDAALRGSFFRNRASAVRILRSIFFPFSSFGINQKNRMWNDLNSLFSGKDIITSSRSLVSIAGELVVYNAIRYYIAKTILGATLSLLGYDDDDQEELYNKLLNNAKLSSFSKLFTDIVSPVPVLDNQTLKLANKALKGSSLFQADPEAVDKYVEKLKAKGNLTDEEIEAKKKAFEEKNSRSFYIDTEANIGTLGIQYDKAIELLDLVNAWRTGEYTDDYNNERFLTKDSREKLTAPLMMKFFATVYGTRELDQVANKSFKLVKDAESLSKTQKENYDGVKKELGRDLTEFETAIVKKKRTIDTGISEIKYLESKGKFTKQQGSEYLKLLDVFPSPSDEMIIDIQNGKKAADIIKKNKV